MLHTFLNDNLKRKLVWYNDLSNIIGRLCQLNHNLTQKWNYLEACKVETKSTGIVLSTKSSDLSTSELALKKKNNKKTIENKYKVNTWRTLYHFHQTYQSILKWALGNVGFGKFILPPTNWVGKNILKFDYFVLWLCTNLRLLFSHS